MSSNGNGNEYGERVRVLIAVADEGQRADLRAVIAQQPDTEVVGMVGDGERATRLASQIQPDIVILDESMPRVDGISAAEEITLAVPTCLIILMLESGDLDSVRQAMTAGAREFVVKPVSAEDVVKAIRRLLEKETKRRQAQQGGAGDAPSGPARQKLGRIFAVWGPKGGAGRTFLAVNIALALQSKKPNRVLILDACSGFGSVDVLLDVVGRRSIFDWLSGSNQDLDPDLIAQIAVRHSSGLDVLVASSILGALAIRASHMERLLGLLCRLYDYVVIDTNSHLDEATVALLDVSDTVLVICTPELPSLRNLRAFLDASTKLGYSPDKTWLIINRFDMRGAIALADIEKICHFSITASIPNDHESAATSINQGKPIVLHQPNKTLAREIMNLAMRLSGEQEQPQQIGGQRSLPTLSLGRLLSRPAGRGQ